MAFNGNGIFNRIHNWVTDAANSINISSSRMDAEMDGFAVGLTNCITKDGQSTPSANIPFNNKKLTGVADPTAAQDAATKAYVDTTAAAEGAIADGSLTTAKYADDSVTNPKIADDAVEAAQVADGAIGTAALVDGGVTQAKLAAGINPIGSVIDFVGISAPSGWLLCFGQAISRTTYSALFAITSTTYGNGNGSTTFNLPDLRGRVTAGTDNMGGTPANRLTGQSGGVDGDRGDVGGNQTNTLTDAQMPSHFHLNGVGDADSNIFIYGFTATDVPGDATENPSSVSPDPTRQGLTSSVGSDQPHNNVQPTLVLNKIIYTGV